MRYCWIVILGIVCFLGVAVAQNATAPAPQPAPPVAAPVAIAVPASSQDQVVVLREGTPVKLKFAQSLSSKTAADDDPVSFLVAEDLLVGDIVVAKAGTFAAGSVSHSKRAGMLGKAGELNIRLSHLKCGDKKIKLRGAQGKEGQGKEGTVMALTVLFGPIGLIKHGKNVEVKEGAPLVAYVDEDYTLPRTVRAD
jgi:hypothetical protein